MRNVQIVLRIRGADGKFQRRKIRELSRQSAKDSTFETEDGTRTNVAVRSRSLGSEGWELMQCAGVVQVALQCHARAS